MAVTPSDARADTGADAGGANRADAAKTALHIEISKDDPSEVEIFRRKFNEHLSLKPKLSKWVLDPRKSTTLSIWDAIVTSCLLVTAFLTPCTAI